MERSKLMIVVNLPMRQIPFNVWRDLGRLAGCSISTPDKEVFEFLANDPKDLQAAERILQGALFKPVCEYGCHELTGMVAEHMCSSCLNERV